MRVVVTGGQGTLGSLVMAAVRGAGHDAVSASRRSGVDLATGSGLAAVLVGADAVVHTADTTNPRRFQDVTVDGTRRLAEAALAQPTPPHLVYISIVGVDRQPQRYYRAKLAAEQAVEAGGGPVTVLRATQFHSLVAAMARWGTVGPVAFRIRGMEAQPVDTAYLAARLAELATGPAPSGFVRTRDVAGPDRLDLATVADLVSAHRRRRLRWRVGLPPVGGTMHAFAEGAVLPGAGADLGGQRFEEWLAEQPVDLRGR